MNNPALIKNFKAEAAIAAYRIVKFGADDSSVLQSAAATDSMFGVCGPLAGELGKRVDITLTGVAEVEYGAAVTRGDRLTADASGRAIPVTRHTHTENTAAAYAQNATTGAGTGSVIIGIAMVSGVLGDIGSVNIVPSLA